MITNKLLHIIHVLLFWSQIFSRYRYLQKTNHIFLVTEGITWFTALNHPNPWKTERPVKIPTYIRKFWKRRRVSVSGQVSDGSRKILLYLQQQDCWRSCHSVSLAYFERRHLPVDQVASMLTTSRYTIMFFDRNRSKVTSKSKTCINSIAFYPDQASKLQSVKKHTET